VVILDCRLIAIEMELDPLRNVMRLH